MEKLLLNEVNRLREIMGLQILKEDRSKIVQSAEKLFISSAAQSVEKEFLGKLKGAADDTDFYKVLRDVAYVAETKTLMREVILGANQKLFSQMESKILGFKNNKMVDDKIKKWIDNTIDEKLVVASDDVKNLYKTQYKSYVDDLTAGANSKDVFGRDITPYVKKTKKPGTSSTTTPGVDLAAAKANIKNLSAMIPDKEVRNMVNKQINELTEDTIPVNPQAWVKKKTDEIYDLKTSLIQGEGNLADAKRVQTKKEREAANELADDIMKGAKTKMTLGRKLLWSTFIFSGVVLLIYCISKLVLNPRDTLEEGINHFTKTNRDLGIDENTIKETEQKIVKEAKELTAPPQSSAFDDPK